MASNFRLNEDPRAAVRQEEARAAATAVNVHTRAQQEDDDFKAYLAEEVKRVQRNGGSGIWRQFLGDHVPYNKALDPTQRSVQDLQACLGAFRIRAYQPEGRKPEPSDNWLGYAETAASRGGGMALELMKHFKEAFDRAEAGRIKAITDLDEATGRPPVTIPEGLLNTTSWSMSKVNRKKIYMSGWVCQERRSHAFGDLPVCTACQSKDNLLIYVGDKYYSRPPRQMTMV